VAPMRRGSIKRGSFTEEELAQGWGEAFAAFQLRISTSRSACGAGGRVVMDES